MTAQDQSPADRCAAAEIEYADKTVYAFDFGGADEISVQTNLRPVHIRVTQQETVSEYDVGVRLGADIETTVNNGVVTLSVPTPTAGDGEESEEGGN